MTMEVNYNSRATLHISEEEFRKKMLERIKSNFSHLLDEKDQMDIEMGDAGFERIIKKYFEKP